MFSGRMKGGFRTDRRVEAVFLSPMGIPWHDVDGSWHHMLAPSFLRPLRFLVTSSNCVMTQHKDKGLLELPPSR